MNSETRKNPALFAIFAGGGIAGSLDITYAILISAFRGTPPMRLLQSVATGLLGPGAYEGGASTAVLGFVLHFLIAFMMAAAFYLISRRFDFLVRRPVVSGLIYGAILYPFMTQVVLPLSAYPHPFVFRPLFFAINLFVHMFLVGLPIALATKKASG
ncbi:hypothetical protein HNQ60_001838 [Povalibacter uvarum]|uniref:DUF1440 domain-containing protein n=1 Tax=Povalibacter uvarum TaxID=732238 RepID=A0A841HKZ1_9GAMM|nr:hypothetical protein [Povalibacter uvarum]MBB6092960.1 hypothetical protein [Povalibacter uvarum]